MGIPIVVSFTELHRKSFFVLFFIIAVIGVEGKRLTDETCLCLDLFPDYMLRSTVALYHGKPQYFTVTGDTVF